MGSGKWVRSGGWGRVRGASSRGKDPRQTQESHSTTTERVGGNGDPTFAGRWGRIWVGSRVGLMMQGRVYSL